LSVRVTGRPLAALALLALLASPAAAASLQAGFDAPAQVQGDLSAGGVQWALLVFHGPAAAFTASLESGQETNHTTAYLQPPTQSAPLPVGLQPAVSGMRAVEGHLAVQPESWALLFLQADRIGLAAHADGAVGVSRAGGAAQESLPPGPYPDVASRQGPFATPRGAALSLAPNGTQPLRFTLEAHGVRSLEWHNATFACATAGPCPSRAAAWTPAPSLVAGNVVQMKSYVELEVPGGELAGEGTAVAIAAGGPALDLALAGSLRLPGARITGQCGSAACPDPAGRTFLATGNLTLAGLAPDPASPARLAAHLSGTFHEAAYDESPAPGFTVPPAAALAATLGLTAFLAALLGRHLWALFARSQRPPPLQHPRRQQLLDLIQRDPGLSFRGLQRSLGWPTGPLQAHLARLVQARLVVAQPHRNTVRYFENHGRYAATWKEVTLLRDPATHHLHAWVQATPGRTQQEIVAATHAWGWSRAKALRQLAGLEEAGLIVKQRAGRTVRYATNGAPHRATSGPAGI
jgi:predicted transcriptional regulator